MVTLDGLTALNVAGAIFYFGVGVGLSLGKHKSNDIKPILEEFLRNLVKKFSLTKRKTKKRTNTKSKTR